jgi:hypothetical protein
MQESEGMQYGLGYAESAEQFSGIKTAQPTDQPGFLAFATAYATAWAECNAGKRSYMTSCRDAYETWQVTGGITIFRNAPMDCECLPGVVCPPCTARGYKNGLAGYAGRLYPQRVTADDIAEQERADAGAHSE